MILNGRTSLASREGVSSSEAEAEPLTISHSVSESMSFRFLIPSFGAWRELSGTVDTMAVVQGYGEQLPVGIGYNRSIITQSSDGIKDQDNENK